MTTSSLRRAGVTVIVLATVSLVAAAPVPTPRLIRADATYLQVTWDGQGQNFQVVATAADGSDSQRSPIVNRGPVTLVNLAPATKYLVKVQTVAFTVETPIQPAAGAALRVVGESPPLEVVTQPWQARDWSDLRLWPSRHADSFAAGATHPALAAHAGELLLVEAHHEGLYVSRLDSDDLRVIAQQQLCSLPGQQVVNDVDAAVIGEILWVTWITQARGTVRATNGVQMLLSYDLQTGAVNPPVELHRALGCALTTLNGRLWLLWRTEDLPGTTLVARYEPGDGVQEPQEWSVERATWAEAAPVNLGAELLLAGLKSVGSIQPPTVGRRPYQLWAAKFDGQRFYELRMLRGTGDYSSPSGGALNNAIVMAYANSPGEGRDTMEGSDIDITLSTGPARVSSVSYIHDGTYNLAPDVTRLGDALFVAYNKWSGSPEGSSNSINYGTFIGKIELKF